MGLAKDLNAIWMTAWGVVNWLSIRNSIPGYSTDNGLKSFIDTNIGGLRARANAGFVHCAYDYVRYVLGERTIDPMIEIELKKARKQMTEFLEKQEYYSLECPKFEKDEGILADFYVYPDYKSDRVMFESIKAVFSEIEKICQRYLPNEIKRRAHLPFPSLTENSICQNSTTIKPYCEKQDPLNAKYLYKEMKKVNRQRKIVLFHDTRAIIWVFTILPATVALIGFGFIGEVGIRNTLLMILLWGIAGLVCGLIVNLLVYLIRQLVRKMPVIITTIKKKVRDLKNKEAETKQKHERLRQERRQQRHNDSNH